MLGVSNSVVYQLTDYIGYDIMLQYIQELLPAGPGHDCHRELSAGCDGQCSGESESGTATDCHFPEPVQVQQDALLVVERQMSYMRQQLSARMLSRYQNNYHFGGNSL